MTTATIIALVISGVSVLAAFSVIFYAKVFKRVYDIIISFTAILILSPLFIVLSVVGAIEMEGCPFFAQPRQGKDGKFFKMIKFRTMTVAKDAKGNFLPDEKRLTKYGKFLRKTSIDELPQLFNILKGDMSLIGPRLMI